MFNIYLLKDKQQFIDKISEVNFNEWNDFYINGNDTEISSLEDYKNYVKENYLNTDKIPICLVATCIVDNKEIFVGNVTISYEDFPDLPTNKIWLTELYVIPEYRNKGVGKLLIKSILDICKDLKIECIYLSCVEDLIFYYKNLGFNYIDRHYFESKTYYIFYKNINII